MNQRPQAPEAPMIVAGQVLPGDTLYMLRCLCEELLLGGIPLRRLWEMSRDPNYQALYAARVAVGDAAFERLLEQIRRSVGVFRCRLTESPQTEQSVELNIQAGPRRAGPAAGGEHA